MRVEPRRRMRRLILGLLADLPRKNCWTIAEWAGEANPDGMQHLLNRAKWDADAVRDDLREYVVENLHDDQAVLVVDETGDMKKAATPSASNGSTPAPQAGSRTPRSPSTWFTRASADTQQWTASSTSRAHGPISPTAARRPGSPRHGVGHEAGTGRPHDRPVPGRLPQRTVGGRR